MMYCKRKRNMTKPLALVFYERLLLGRQLVNRLVDIGYRVNSISDLKSLESIVLKEQPLVLLLDLHTVQGSVANEIRSIRNNQATMHIPILGFTGKQEEKLHSPAVKAGANMVALDEAMLRQLPQMLEQLLRVE